MSEAQTVKTAIHEICHALVDDKDHVRIEGIDTTNRSRSDKEVTAEAVAYTVASALFDLDTSEYSFGYIAGWSSGKELPELRASMETIRKTASKLINDISDALKEIKLEQTPSLKKKLEVKKEQAQVSQERKRERKRESIRQ